MSWRRLSILGFCQVLFLASHGASLLAWSAHPDPPAVMTEDLAKGLRFYRLPIGTPLTIFLQSPLNSAVNQLQDPVEATITQSMYLGSDVLLSKNTRFRGVITRLELPIQGRNAILGVHFTELVLDSGEHVPIEAHVYTDSPDNNWGGGLTSGTKWTTVTHRVLWLGDYNQMVLGGPRAMGTHVQFPPGERWTIILDQPVSLVLPKKEVVN